MVVRHLDVADMAAIEEEGSTMVQATPGAVMHDHLITGIIRIVTLHPMVSHRYHLLAGFLRHRVLWDSVLVYHHLLPGTTMEVATAMAALTEAITAATRRTTSLRRRLLTAAVMEVVMEAMAIPANTIDVHIMVAEINEEAGTIDRRLAERIRDLGYGLAMLYWGLVQVKPPWRA